jgi:hypothetical protein
MQGQGTLLYVLNGLMHTGQNSIQAALLLDTPAAADGVSLVAVDGAASYLTMFGWLSFASTSTSSIVAFFCLADRLVVLISFTTTTLPSVKRRALQGSGATLPEHASSFPIKITTRTSI